MPERLERDRSLSRLSGLLVLMLGLYLIIVPIAVPSFGWNGLVEKFGETRILTLLVGFLFLYLYALAREKDRLRLVTGEILQGLKSAVRGADTKSQKEAVVLLMEGLRADSDKVREMSLRQLRRLTGADPGSDYESWRAWWKENGESFTAGGAAAGRAESPS